VPLTSFPMTVAQALYGAALLPVFAAACAKQDAVRPEQVAAAAGTSETAPLELPSGHLLTVPAGWKRLAGQPPFRVAELIPPRAAGDESDAKLVVSYFAGGVGPISANVERWLGQVRGPDGAPIARDRAKVREEKIGSIKATVFDAEGKIVETSMGGPM